MKHRAIVKWLSPEEGGRMRMPTYLRYVGIGHFADDDDSVPHDKWSVVIEFDGPPAKVGDDVGPATVHFLFETAPQSRLHPGVRLSVHEGRGEWRTSRYSSDDTPVAMEDLRCPR